MTKRHRKNDNISAPSEKIEVAESDGLRWPLLQYPPPTFQALAERYWNLWPTERDALYQLQDNLVAELREKYGVDDVGLWELAGKAIDGASQDPERHKAGDYGYTLLALAEDELRLVTAFAQHKDNVLTHTFFDPAHEPRLGIASDPVMFYRWFLDASDEELRRLPPVGTNGRSRLFHLYGVDLLPRKIPTSSQVEAAFDALATAERNVMAIGPRGLAQTAADYIEAKIAAAVAAWGWYKETDNLPASRGRGHISQIPAADFLMPSAQVFQGAHRALISSDGWIDGKTDFPFYDDTITAIRYSIGGITGDGSFNPTTDGGFQADLATLDPKMSLVYAAAMGAWTQAFHTGSLRPGGCVAVHVNDVLDLRGVKRHHTRDYKSEQKREVASRLRDLTKLRVRGEGKLPDGKKIRLTGQLLEIVEAETEDLFGYTPYGFLIRPGAAVAPFFESSPQFATFFQKLAQLDTRQGVERIAYHLGLYLVFQFRIRQSHNNYAQPFLVRTLLDGARVAIETNSKLFTRFNNQVEEALNRLQEIGVIAGWEYAKNDEESLPARGWFRAWLDRSRILISPPLSITNEATFRVQSQKKRLSRSRVPRKAS